MQKNQVTDPITDQEIAFAHMVLSGTMTDRRAAGAVGLNPDIAAYTKAKPRVQAYMLEHRAAVHKEVVQQEVDGLRRLELGREQVLARLWEIASLSHEVTRNSVTAQLKALSLIIAMEGMIPDRRSAEKKSALPLPATDFYRAAWLGKPQGEAIEPNPINASSPDLIPDPIEDKEKSGIPSSGAEEDAAPVPVSAADPGEPLIARRVSRAETPQWVPGASASAPDMRIPFDRFGRRR